MSATDIALHRDNRAAFHTTWTQASLTQLHHDVFMELQRHLGGSILVAPIFTTVTTEHAECATRLWDALISAFHPRSPQVVADFLAEATVAILRGPDHDTVDPTKAFRQWDAAVGALNQHALDLPPLTAQMLCACLMYASLHASKEDSYYQAYMQLQATLALPSVLDLRRRHSPRCSRDRLSGRAATPFLYLACARLCACQCFRYVLFYYS